MGSGENEGAILFTDVPLELVCIAGETLLPHFQTFHILNVLLKSPPKTVRNIKMFSYVKKKKERRKGGRKEKRFILGPPSLSTYCCCSCSVMSDSLWPIGLQLYRLLCVFQSRILEWLPFPSRGDLASLGIRPESLALQVDSLLAEPSGKLLLHPRAEKQWCDLSAL